MIIKLWGKFRRDKPCSYVALRLRKTIHRDSPSSISQGACLVELHKSSMSLAQQSVPKEPQSEPAQAVHPGGQQYLPLSDSTPDIPLLHEPVDNGQRGDRSSETSPRNGLRTSMIGIPGPDGLENRKGRAAFRPEGAFIVLSNTKKCYRNRIWSYYRGTLAC